MIFGVRETPDTPSTITAREAPEEIVAMTVKQPTSDAATDDEEA